MRARHERVLKVRIKTRPRAREIDGVKLDGFKPGTVRDVSPSVGSWLIVEGYAEAEMRKVDSEDSRSDRRKFTGLPRDIAQDRRRNS